MNERVRLSPKSLDGKGRADQIAVWSGNGTLAGSEDLIVKDGRLINQTEPVVTEAPRDGKVYGRSNATWTPVGASGGGGGGSSTGSGDGEAGPQGEPGPIGPQGPAGATGATGPQGVPGADGMPGLQGPTGAQGIQGPPGEPQTPSNTNPIVNGTAAPGTSLLYTRGDHVHPTDTTRAAITQVVRYDAPQTLTAAQRSQARSNIDVTKKNYIVNGGMQINQEGYVSAAVLAAGAYGHDQWKAGAAGGDYSFTQSKSVTTITIAAGKSLIQPIEDVRVTGGGSYVLAWTGTAQARAGVNTLTPAGSYAASPLLITGQTDGTVMSIEFSSGTLSGVSLTEGSVAPPFQLPDYATELALCQRYYQKSYPLAVRVGTPLGSGVHTVVWGIGANSAYAFTIPFTTRFRSTPTVTVWDDNGNGGLVSFWSGSAWGDGLGGQSITPAESGFMFGINTTWALIGFNWAANARL